MYNNFLGLLYEPPEEYSTLIENRRKANNMPRHSYDKVRHGLPFGVVKHEESKGEIKILLDHYFKHGYDNWPFSKLTTEFRRHVAKFRACLDLWEELSTSKVFCKDELYVRCLREGHSFTEYVKKCRATCLRAKTSETETEIDEDEYFDEYTGFNSILDERYLIHWDDRETVHDIKHAFIPAKKDRTADFERMLDTMWEDFRLDDVEWPSEFDMIGSLKNTKMYDPVEKRSALMREFWSKDVSPSAPYFAKRTVVPTSPGKTRDTGLGDPSTILKVKQLNALARAISERLPYSANAPGPICNARLKRVLKKNAFLHLDFKKFGLTFPRKLMNSLIRKIGKSSGCNLDYLLIDSFYVEIDGEVFQTERGTMLGWLDSMNSICFSAILHHLSKNEELMFDFITFNDDVEISKRCESALPETMELLRLAVISELDSFDIPISMKKTYASRASVFLERYCYFTEEYGLDMYKEQLTVEAFAKSLVTEFPWQAKMFFSAAWQWTKSEYARDRCIDTCPIEFRQDEIHMPLWSGGWYINRTNELDTSLNDCDRFGFRLGLELAKFHPPRYATRRQKVSDFSKISDKIHKEAFRSSTAALYRHIHSVEETIEELNSDYELLHYKAETACSVYPGRNVFFAQAILRVVNSHPWEGEKSP
jgi:hypothetical protein